MDALQALHTRTSSNILTDPGPDQEQLNSIIQAGLRACDHRNLRPWRYLLVDGDDRYALGDLFVKVKTSMEGASLSNDIAEKIRSKPLRAPTILVVIASVKEHPKVPEIEQLLSAGASAQMMMTAAFALGIGAIWRSGSLMFQTEMKKGLGLDDDEQLVGFIYLGTAKIVKPTPQLDPADFMTRWHSAKD